MKRGEIIHNEELFYVLGALLGDGCAYHWKKKDYRIILLVGNNEFTEKYADKLFKCTGKRVKPCINRNKNVWQHKISNIQLFSLFKKIRINLAYLNNLMKKGDHYKNSLQFIEGFFDAEGCVKTIKEKIRKTPKICLDITNTNFEILELVRKLLEEHLNIIAKYSIQKAFIGKDGSLRQKIYHLRIYKKEFIRKFFANMSTIKLNENKKKYLENWLNNGK